MKILLILLILLPTLTQAEESYRTNYYSDNNYENPYPINDYKVDTYYTYTNRPDYD